MAIIIVHTCACINCDLTDAMGKASRVGATRPDHLLPAQATWREGGAEKTPRCGRSNQARTATENQSHSGATQACVRREWQRVTTIHGIDINF